MHSSKHRVNIGVQGIYQLHQMGESVTHPIELCCDALAALLLLAECSLRRRRALPERRIITHSGAFNCRF